MCLVSFAAVICVGLIVGPRISQPLPPTIRPTQITAAKETRLKHNLRIPKPSVAQLLISWTIKRENPVSVLSLAKG